MQKIMLFVNGHTNLSRSPYDIDMFSRDVTFDGKKIEYCLALFHNLTNNKKPNKQQMHRQQVR
jgi:hypothetical protein